MKDITFSYPATFFLFATLEQARPMAVPRGGNISANSPVLTGGPVSGMAYLDRPSPAGYFLFPDLSIRHEGMYKLKFALWEHPKEAGMDSAKLCAGHPSQPELRKKRRPLDAQHYMECRASIQTENFNVFSAKKFPGLSESTPLSKTLSDQGCRVRIRRDVRLRRPKQHLKDINTDMGDEPEFSREQASPSPAPTSATLAMSSDSPKPSMSSSHPKTPTQIITDGSTVASPTTFNPARYRQNADGSVTSAFTYPVEQMPDAGAQTLRAVQSMNDIRTATVSDASYQADEEGPSIKRARLPPVQTGAKSHRLSDRVTQLGSENGIMTKIEVDASCVVDANSSLDRVSGNKKRLFGHTFNTGAITAPLADGARPLSPKDGLDMEAASSSSGEEQRIAIPRYHYPIPLEFRRAAGSSRNRTLPNTAAAATTF